MPYAIKFEGRTFTPEGERAIDDVNSHNAAIEANELTIWAAKPECFAGYVTNGNFTTFLGTAIGRVIKASVYRNNFGKRLRAVTIAGNNGALYHGRYGVDWGDLVRVKRSKGK